MYSTLNSINILLVKSIEKINKYDRNNYKKFFSIIENYILNNNLIIGGNFANMVLNSINFEKEINYSIYEIYSEEPKEDAIQLSNLLFKCDPSGIARYTYVFPYIENNIYYIYLNGRQLCTIKKMPIYKGVKIEQLIISQLISSIYDNIKILCMGNYIQLINLYNEINNPNFSQNWEKNISLEKKIRELYVDSIKDKNIKFHKDMTLAQQDNQYEEKNDLSFIYTYINNSNRVIIGEIGHYILMNKNKKIQYNDLKKFRLELITTNRLEDEGKLLNDLGKKYNIDIQWSIALPKYIDDFYLKRLTAYAIIDGNKKNILDMFNYGEYNAIGYNNITIYNINKSEKNIKYGSIFLIMRFRLIDEWIFNFLYELKSIEETYAKLMIKNIQNNFLLLSKYMDKHLSTESNIISYFNNLQYIGIYKDINLELKRKSKQIKKITQSKPYYPLQSLNE